MTTTYTPRHARPGRASAPQTAPAPSSAAESATSSEPGGAIDPAPAPSILLLFIGLMLIMLMSSLNQTVLSPALPTIVGELDGVEHMSWVITAFILVSTIMMPIYGKLGDLWGRKPLLIFAILAFTAGSVTGALAESMTGLIVSRGLQGLGGGGLMILSQAVIADVIPARERGKYMGALMGVFAFSSVAGPLLGGWLTEGPGWRWGFWMNVPLGALALAAAVFLIPHTNAGARTRRARIDVLGMALLAAATACLVLAMTWGGNQYAWNSPTILGLLGAVVVAAALFVPVELRAAEPVMPMALFRDRNFVLTTVAGLCMGIAMFGAIGYMPTYLQMVLGVDATQAGLLMIPMMGTMLVTSVTVGALVSKLGRYKAFMVAGSLLIAAGLFCLSRLATDTATYLICLALAVVGLGLGMSMQLLTLVVQNSFPVSMVGTATAGANFFRQVGATVGSAVVGSLFISRLKDLLAENLPKIPGKSAGAMDANSFTPQSVHGLPAMFRDPVIQSYNDALLPIFLFMIPLAVLAFVLLLFVEEKPLATRVDRTGTGEISTVQATATESGATGATDASDTSDSVEDTAVPADTGAAGAAEREPEPVAPVSSA